MADLMDVLMICSELDEDLLNIKRENLQRNERIKKHLNSVETKLKYTIPDFGKGISLSSIHLSVYFS